MFIDANLRRIHYLRLSLTPACSMRCLYCRPDTLLHQRHGNLLNPAEIERLVRYLVERHELHKIRLTGGDPTARPELMDIIARLACIPGLADLAMTTNGLTLSRHAEAYRKAGLRRVNISLDSLESEQFEQMTGVAGLERVIHGIDAAMECGLQPIKLNTVVIRDMNEEQLPNLVLFAADRDLEIRFIELMPMGPLGAQWEARYVPAAQMKQHLQAVVCEWQPLPQGQDSAKRYRVTLRDGRTATIGFITPMSCPFCSACNRIRIAADGTLFACLMDEPSCSLLPALRPEWNPQQLDRLLRQSLHNKQPEHPHQGSVNMIQIGG